MRCVAVRSRPASSVTKLAASRLASFLDRRGLEAFTAFFPFVQKLRRAGYDGRGVRKFTDRAELRDGFDAPSVVERLVEFETELARLLRDLDRKALFLVVLGDDVHAAEEDGLPVAQVVAETIWHEFAHHFGMDEHEVRVREEERVTNMLRSLGRAELEAALAAQGEIVVTDDLCNERYHFNAEQVAKLFEA